MTKIYVTYEIEPPTRETFHPHDLVRGKVVLQNRGQAPRILKDLKIVLVEGFEEDTGEGMEKKELKLREYPLSRFPDNLPPDQVVKVPFSIMLPKKLPRKKRKKHDWHLALKFYQKTRLIASRGRRRSAAYCVLPVAGSDRASDLSPVTFVGSHQKLTPVAKEPSPKVKPARVAKPVPAPVALFCGNCGEEIAPKIKFCPYCGTKRSKS